MHQTNERKAWPRLGRALAIAGGLLCVTALSQPNLAFAGPHGGGGGGFHGGGFGGFHGGGMGGFHGSFAGMRGGGFSGFHGDRFRDGRIGGDRFRDNRFFLGGAFVYPYWNYYPDYGDYGYSQPYDSQTWYYCSDPTGYYPYVGQCNTGWEAVPAN